MQLKLLRTIDWTLVALPVLLVVAGVITIYSTTLGTSQTYLAGRQILFAVLGLILMFACTVFNYRALKSYAGIFYLLSIGLLFLVLMFGKKIFGATRWIDFGVFQLQPSEILKISMTIFTAAFLSSGATGWLKRLIWLLAIFAVPIFLVLRQPDLGTAIVISFVFLGLFFIWPIHKKIKIIAVIVMIAIIPLGWFLMRDYQHQRIRTFIDPGSDPYGSGYNVIQSIIAVGSGGIWGRGLGNGPQSQLNFLPVSHTDFIFAGWAEATGLIGSVALIITMIILNWRIYNVAKIAQDDFGRYLAVGFGVIFTVQTVINIGMNLGIAPVTGIPLPYVSAGGTALMTNFISLGILQSIYVRNKK